MQWSVAACLASILELDVAEVPAGTVEAIVVAPEAEASVVQVARADRGLEGDRCFNHRGTLSNAHGRVGGVECFGQRLCEPCADLQRLTDAAGKTGTLRALIHEGGLRADVLGDGEIRVGDEIAAR